MEEWVLLFEWLVGEDGLAPMEIVVRDKTAWIEEPIKVRWNVVWRVREDGH